MKLASLLLCVSSLALAQPTPAGADKCTGKHCSALDFTATAASGFKNATDWKAYTTADVALFVDAALGSDAATNNCLAAGALVNGQGACATGTAAALRIPKLLRHKATVTFAAGNYAGFSLSGFTVDPGVQRATAGLVIDGALANVTPTTGSATGTATAGTAGTGAPAVFSTMTDAAATWTVNDSAMVGKFLVFTGGTGSGQVRVIVSNTATVITMAGVGTAATGTTTYAIQTPSVVFTSAAAALTVPIAGTNPATFNSAAGLQIVGNSFGPMGLVIRNVGISIAATTGVLVANNVGVTVVLQVKVSNTSGTEFQAASAPMTLTAVSCEATNGTCVAAAPAPGPLLITSSRLLSTGDTFQPSGIGINVSMSGVQATGPRGLNFGNGVTALISGGVRCDCSSSANSACVMATGSSTVSGTLTSNNATGAHVRISSGIDSTNCSYGLFASGDSWITGSSAAILSGNALTYGIGSAWGSKVTWPTNAITLTATTAEMALDVGAATGTFASLLTDFSCLVSLNTSSGICRL